MELTISTVYKFGDWVEDKGCLLETPRHNKYIWNISQLPIDLPNNIFDIFYEYLEAVQDPIAHAAGILHIRNDGKVLGVARRGTVNQWGIPGGKVNESEMTSTCAKRELFEETGIKIDLISANKRFCFTDDDGHRFATYLVKDICNEPMQGDAGPVGFVSWEELISGPFGSYNAKLKQWYEKL